MGNRKHQHAQHVLGSKMAAKKDLMEMLWPVLGATLLFFIPYVLLSEALGLACYGTGMQLREDLTQAQLLSYVLTFEIANLLLVQPLYFGLTQFYALRRAGGRVFHLCGRGLAPLGQHRAVHPVLLRLAGLHDHVLRRRVLCLRGLRKLRVLNVLRRQGLVEYLVDE